MTLLRFPSPERRRFRAVWADSARKRATLELFARTEADGGLDLAVAASRTLDPWLREHLTRHAEDESRHARLFRERASELAELGDASSSTHDRQFELAAERSDLDAHGFLRANLYDDLGEVAYVAMLHVAEVRAAQLFAMHRDLLHDDQGTRAVFAQILKDEAYHVAYTGKALERWRSQGRSREVKIGLDAARGGRLLAGLRRLGARAGTSLGHVLLFVMQTTLLLPAIGFARRGLPRAGWRPSNDRSDASSQA